MDETDGTLTSPHFGTKIYHDHEHQGIKPMHHFYDHNLNCKWILNADQGFYITFEIDKFRVNNDANNIYFYTISNRIHHFSLVRVIIYQSMME